MPPMGSVSKVMWDLVLLLAGFLSSGQRVLAKPLLDIIGRLRWRNHRFTGHQKTPQYINTFLKLFNKYSLNKMRESVRGGLLLMR